MIKNIRHRGLKQFHANNNPRLLNPKHVMRLEILLDALDTAETVQDMNLPGFNLHQLKGERQGTWSVRVSGNWRLTFGFHGGGAYDLDLEDYH